jgi:hypothetical protein
MVLTVMCDCDSVLIECDKVVFDHFQPNILLHQLDSAPYPNSSHGRFGIGRYVCKYLEYVAVAISWTGKWHDFGDQCLYAEESARISLGNYSSGVP